MSDKLSIMPGDRVYQIDEHAGCKAQIHQLERSLAGQIDKYDKLYETYTKLSDIWMAFQGSTHPDQRYVYRAEAQGQMARKLAEAMIGLTHKVPGSMRMVVEALLQILDKEAETVEVSEKLVVRRDK